MKMSMRCRGYTIDRRVNSLVEIHADFMLIISPHESEKIADALATIERMLSGEIDLVKADSDRPCCFHCGSLNEIKANQCSQCGAPL